MPILVGLGGNPERNSEKQSVLKSTKGDLQELFDGRGFLYYWATEPANWPQNALTRTALNRRMELISPIAADLKNLQIHPFWKEKFWKSYNLIPEGVTNDEVDNGLAHYKFSKAGSRLEFERVDPNLTERVAFNDWGLYQRDNLPSLELTLAGRKGDAMQIIRDYGFTNTGAVVFARLIREFAHAKLAK